MVKEGFVLGHKISKGGIEVDRAKIEVIEKLPPPIFMKGVHSFWVMLGFIGDSSRISPRLPTLFVGILRNR